MTDNTARALALEMAQHFLGDGAASELLCSECETICLTALTRARAEGVREGVERAAKEERAACAWLVSKLAIDNAHIHDKWAALHDAANALRTLADSPAGREGTV